MMNSLLPDDILIEIFLRLPAKSVGKCRCLSKTWRTHLNTSQFIKRHLTLRTHQQNHLILISPSKSLHTLTHPITEYNNISRKVKFLNIWYTVVDSCNGLVLLLNEEYEMFLVNPVTSQHVQVLGFYSRSEGFDFMLLRYGFGYDTHNDDYKIVRLLYRSTGMILDVYSVKSGVWKRVNSSPDHVINGSFRGVFMNGAIHWLSTNTDRYPSVIVAFDLADEVFYEIPCPTKDHGWKFQEYSSLYAMDGCLCLVESRGVNKNIWVLKEYGLVDSWIRFSVNGNGKWGMFRPLRFMGEDKIVLITYRRNVLVYNLKDGKSKVMIVDGALACFLDGATFVDSLVSPNQHSSSKQKRTQKWSQNV